MRLPSYQQGFARLVGDGAYQGSLREGLAGYWPVLGATNLALFDQSPFANHGVLTAFPATVPYEADRHGWHLDWGAGDHVMLPLPVSAFPFTMWGLVEVPPGVGAHCIMDIASSADATINLGIDVTAGVGRIFARDGGANQILVGGIVMMAGTWHTIGGIFRSATDRELVIDGRSDGTDVNAVTFHANIDRAAIGIRIDLTPAEPFQGPLAAAAIWSRALTLNELVDLSVDPNLLLGEVA